MTPTQKKLRELRERQSKERGRMAELGPLQPNSPTRPRAELDTIETGTPDLERQLRAATVAVETEETEQRDAGADARQPEGDTEDRERPGTPQQGKARELRRCRNRTTRGDRRGSRIQRRTRYLGQPLPASNYSRRQNSAPRIAPLPPLTPRPCRARGWIACSRRRPPCGLESAWSRSRSVPPASPSPRRVPARRSVARDQAAGDTAWEVEVTELKPKRNAATLKFSIEDTARIPGLESALTRDLRMAAYRGN